MELKLGSKSIVLDEDGYLVNPEDWSEAVAEELAYRYTLKAGLKLTEEYWGLINYVRDFYREMKRHPSMHEVVMTLGKYEGKRYHDHKAYAKYLYELFPTGPVQELARLAGLPKPLVVEQYEAG